MADRFDIRFTWFVRLSAAKPMVRPGFHIDQLEDPHPLEVGDRPLARQHLLQLSPVDDPMRGQAPAEQPVANGWPEMIEQPRREPTGSTLDPPIEDGRG